MITSCLLRSTLGERFVIFGDPVVDGIPVHARREDSRFLVTWTGGQGRKTADWLKKFH